MQLLTLIILVIIGLLIVGVILFVVLTPAQDPPAPTSTVSIQSSVEYLRSKNNTTLYGVLSGNEVEKDMDNQYYTEEFDPYDYQSEFFPDMADFIDENIVQGDKTPENRLDASYWDDLGNDIFDDWGYFYLYDTESGKYYFPLINPQNLEDGNITTQIFEVFGRVFTFKHGWSVQGIFKFDITVDDNKPFIFGAYGNMGSDGRENIQDLTYEYNLSQQNLTLYYQRHSDDNDDTEILYSYWIPKRVSENNTQTYNFYNNEDDNSMMSKQVTNGLIVYFAKTNDVKEWIVNDLELA